MAVERVDANSHGRDDEAGLTNGPPSHTPYTGEWKPKDIDATFTGGTQEDPVLTNEAYRQTHSDKPAVTDKAGLDAYIEGLDQKLSSVGDDAQLANVDLQNILQKQQQTIQLMSNISKMLHDTALAIIRKIGG